MPYNTFRKYKLKIYWDPSSGTDGTVMANRSNVSLFDGINKFVHIIDITVPLSNVLQ
jgi:hypothetical protein